MNVYDFDDTIYDGDSSKDFLLFMVKRHKRAFAKRMFGIGISTFLYVIRVIDKESWKSSVFSFLKDIEDIDREIKKFWDEREKKFKAWYLEQQRQDDLIISASPTFIVEEGCHRIGIEHVIATEMDKTSGKIYGKNCKGREKVERFRQCYGDKAEIEAFYSDSQSDVYMAGIAKRAYYIEKDQVLKWGLGEAE